MYGNLPMKRLTKKAFRLKKHTILYISLFIMLVVFAGLGVFAQFGSKIKVSIENQGRSALSTVSHQNVKMVNEQIGARLRFLTSVADEITRLGRTDINQLLREMRTYDANYNFFNMGIIKKDGICHTTNGETLDLSKYTYFKEGMKGESFVSEGYLAENGSGILNIFVVPVWLNDGVEYLLTATYRTRDFRALMDVTSFDGNGHSLLVNGEGRNVARFYGDVTEAKGVSAVAEYISAKVDIPLEQITEEGVFFDFSYQNNTWMAYCEKVENRDWYLVSYVPYNYLYKDSEMINGNVLSLLAIMYVMIMVVSVMFVMIYQKFQHRILVEVFNDHLTNEVNYQCFKLNFGELRPEEKEEHYLVQLDIDKFKMINLIYGVETGDRLLLQIFEIFKEELPQDVIYHYHADIFVAIVEGKTREAVGEKLQKFLDRISREIEEKNMVECSVSMGVCSLWQFEQISVIYSNAVLAKMDTKDSLTEKYKFYDDTLRVRLEYRSIELAFKEALKNEEFQVWYQPKYDMRTQTICGAEALVRWKKPDGKIIPPIEFIPVFESTGQIVELDREVLRIVCRDIQEARERGLEVRPVSVNLSKLHLMKTGIAEKIREITAKYDIRKSDISFEITESAFFNDKKVMDQLIADLHDMGFKVDMDDYGTGSSTLRSLSDTDFDTLKLDKSFIDSIGSEKMDIIVHSTINMTNELKMNIVAEGVETEEQARFLVEHNCYVAQGYHFSKPVEKEVYFDRLLEDMVKRAQQQ